MRRLRWVIYPLLSFVAAGCYMTRPLASEYQRPVSYAISASEDTHLTRVVAPRAKAHPGQSGFYLITKGEDALTLRLALVEGAERSIDLQYYSFMNDVSGKLLFEAILRAADRGVRVRILVDDLTLNKSDDTWSLLDKYPNIELRIFNPFATREQGLLGGIGNMFAKPGHFTKRMHNKAFVVDNQLSIIGGRNLGDAYFDHNQDFNFRDVDILAAGPITAQVSKSFDSYWNGKEAYPITSVQNATPEPGAKTALREALRAHWKAAVEQKLFTQSPPIAGQLESGALPLIWAKAELAADSPLKVDQAVADSKPGLQLEKLVARADHEFIAVTPYFVPGDDGVAWLKELVDRGVKVRILTNSLASTDVVAVHTGYRRYREEVLADGAELYEMKPIPGKRPRSGRFASSSRASLHTKIYVMDRANILIGTFNLDPRSVELNTEMAFVIHSPELAQQLVKMFEQAITHPYSYQLLRRDSGIEWVTEEDGIEAHYYSEPKAGLWRNVKAGLFGLLPFEDQL